MGYISRDEEVRPLDTTLLVKFLYSVGRHLNFRAKVTLRSLNAITLVIYTINRFSIGGCCAALWNTLSGETIS